MASNFFTPLKSILLLLVLVSFNQNLVAARPFTYGENVSPFYFLKHLQGYHLGEHVNGLNNLKTYLKKFGYYNGSYIENDEFDDSLEAAIKNYQSNFRLKPTGTLDVKTVSKMSKSRCGIPDIINGKTRMQSSKKEHHFHTTSHYSFFEGNPAWPESKRNLTYAFGSNAPPKYRLPITSALQVWASVSQFKFTEIKDFKSADIKVQFFARDHGDGAPFDGPDGELGHAFAPPYGDVHFDAEEPFTTGGIHKDGYDMQSVALHELGHILGLDHSPVEEAIMYPTMDKGEIKGLHSDDIQGLKMLYKQ